jgi:DNA-binding NtrC family response regulator
MLARVVSTTCRDLRAMVNEGRFREDLYSRIAQARITMPPLRERVDDVPALVYHVLQSLPADVQGARTVAKDALDELKRRDYRGNVRELRDTVERAALLAGGAAITLADLTFERMLSGERRRASRPSSAARAASTDGELAVFKDAKRTLVDEFEREYLQALLARTGDNLSRASALSGVERHQLRDLLRKHGLRGT